MTDPTTPMFWREEIERYTEALTPLFEDMIQAGIGSGETLVGDLLGERYSFDIPNDMAVAWAEAQTAEVVAQITKTSMSGFLQEFPEWVASGEHLDILTQKLAPFYSGIRAEMVAVTETTRAFASGNINAWKQDNIVEGMRWETAVDDLVCPICRPLHRAIVSLNSQWSVTPEGTNDSLIVDQPPAHVRCRCGLKPILDMAEVGRVQAETKPPPLNIKNPDVFTPKQLLGLEDGHARVARRYSGPASKIQVRGTTEGHFSWLGKFQGTHIDINYPDMDDIYNVSDYVARRESVSARLAAIEKVIANESDTWSDDWIATTKGKAARMRKQLEDLEKQHRWGVPENGSDLLVHEIGHAVQSDLRTGAFPDIPDFMAPSRIRELGFEWEDMLMSELDTIAFDQGHLISEYATTSAEEYFAECWTQFIQGDSTNIHPRLLEIFEEITDLVDE